jgi:hypothetical protein
MSCIFYNNFKDTKGTKMADPILESSGPHTIYCEFFIAKKGWQILHVPKTAASLLPIAEWHS